MIDITEADDICLVRPVERENPPGLCSLWVDTITDAGESFLSPEEITLSLFHQNGLMDAPQHL